MSWSERLAPARAAWAERSVREQSLLGVMALLLVGVVVWYLILTPAWAWRDQARASHERAVTSFETMVAGVERYQAEAAAAARPQAGAALRTVVGASAAERGLAISRVQPLEDGRLGVWMEGVSDDALMAWLIALAREEGVRVDQISIDREGDRQVRAQLVLVRGAGA